MKLSEYLTTPDQEGREKHVPELMLKDGILEVWVGKEVAHPNTIEHHISWIEVFAIPEAGPAKFLARFELGPTLAQPHVTVPVVTEGIKGYIAVENCNIHGLWENRIKV